MSPRVDSPVQTRIAIPVPDGVGVGGKNGLVGISTRSACRRRIFVQTDKGSVLGIELDKSDNAQTVKKKMQTLMNVPADQTALVFGDTVYKGDLSEVRNDSPLLLARELERSLSTPCIYASPDIHGFLARGQPLEVVGGLKCCIKLKRIMKEINKAINCGVEPVPVSGGLGGAYYFRNMKGDSVAIVKPTDEEPFAPNNPKGYVGRSLGQPGLKKTVRVGETGVREVAAYLLDHENFANVPPTVLVKVAHNAFHLNDGASMGSKGREKICQPVAKLASCQLFVDHDCDASDHGTSRYSVAAVHRIGILDIRIFNTDRHGGNILIRNLKATDRNSRCPTAHVSESLELIPIDHGLCLPEALEDPYFEWLHWPQASLPFTEEELDYIKRLDENRDADELRRKLPMLRVACIRMLILSTTLLKRAAAAGLCLAEIGKMMSRDGIEEESELEQLCMQAKIEVEREFLSKHLCSHDHNDTSVCEISAGEDSCEQFEFELHQDFVYKLNCLFHQPQLLRKNFESGNLKLDPLNFSLLPVSVGPRDSSTSCLKDVHSNHAFLQAWPQVPAVREFNESSCTCKVSAGGPGLQADRCEPLQKLSLSNMMDMKSSRNSCIECRRSVCPESCSSVEEKFLFTENDTKSSDDLQGSNLRSQGSLPLRSVSFHDRKQGYLNRCEHKISASETTRKGRVNGGCPSFSPRDLTEEEWSCFMNHFERLLQQALTNRQDSRVCHRPRLGISCQF